MTAGRGIVHSEVRWQWDASAWLLHCVDGRGSCCVCDNESVGTDERTSPFSVQMPVSTGGDDLHGFQVRLLTACLSHMAVVARSAYLLLSPCVTTSRYADAELCVL